MRADLVVPTSRDAILALDSQALYLLEQAGEIARGILDERIVAWTTEGWTQTKIAEEIGCSQQTVSRRQAWLGVQPSQPNAPHSPRKVRAPSTSEEATDGEVVDAEVVDAEPSDNDASDRANGQTHQPYDPGPSVKCPTCGHMVRPDDIQVWAE